MRYTVFLNSDLTIPGLWRSNNFAAAQGSSQCLSPSPSSNRPGQRAEVHSLELEKSGIHRALTTLATEGWIRRAADMGGTSWVTSVGETCRARTQHGECAP
jgi:hypothetical protein